MKDELGEKIPIEIAALRPKPYGYLTDNNEENKKQKSVPNLNLKIINIDYKQLNLKIK